MPGSPPAPRDPSAPNGPRSRCPRARHHVPVQTAPGPEGDTVRDPAGAPHPARRRAPRRDRAGGRGARGVQSRARNADAPASPALCPRPPRPRPGAARPLRPPAPSRSCGGTQRSTGTDSAPAGPAAPAPLPPAAPRPAPSHLPRRSAQSARSAAVAATRLPFSLALRKTGSAVSRAPAPRPPTQLPLAVRGPLLPRLLPRSAPPLAPLRSARGRALCPPLRSARGRARPLTSPASASPLLRPAWTCARPTAAPPPPRRPAPRARARSRHPRLDPVSGENTGHPSRAFRRPPSQAPALALPGAPWYLPQKLQKTLLK